MANWSVLKAAVANIINTNGNQAITGQLLQNVLNNIITNVGENSAFAGIATVDTNPGAPDGPVFYLTATAGVYPNFNSLEVLDGEAVIFEWDNGTWSKKLTGFATQEKLTNLQKETGEKLSQLGQKVDYIITSKETIPNVEYRLSQTVDIKKGQKFVVAIDGANELITNNALSLLFNDKAIEGGAVFPYKRLFTAEDNITEIRVVRGASGVVGVGEITLGVNNANSLPKEFEYSSFEVDKMINNISDEPLVVSSDVVVGANMNIIFQKHIPKNTPIIISLQADAILSNNNATTVYVNDVAIGAQNLNTQNRYIFDYDVDVIRINRSATGVVKSGTVVATLIYSKIEVLRNSDKQKVFYVSPMGNNLNDGDKDNPMLTINACLALGASTIYIFGGIYEQTIDLSLAQVQTINIIGLQGDNRVLFKAPKRIITESTDELYYGKKVYRCLALRGLSEQCKWIFQENVNDANTLISVEDRMPMQNGKQYRCEHTAIRKCSATTLDAAYEEIENSNEYKFYIQGGYLYYSRPIPPSVQNPISTGDNSPIFSNANKHTVNLTNIHIQFMSGNLNNTINSKVVDCSAGYSVWNGAWTWHDGQSIEFVRCEGTRCCWGNNGDGFNAAVSNNVAEDTTATLIDCWAHDNNDDGYSTHSMCRDTIIGGLYEYNKKGGIFPATGCHCYCEGVVSRYNPYGFANGGSVDDQPNGTQLYCVSCVAEKNTLAGYIAYGENNQTILTNCLSINNAKGYVSDNDGNITTLINCLSLNDSEVKSGNFIVKNGEVVI